VKGSSQFCPLLHTVYLPVVLLLFLMSACPGVSRAENLGPGGTTRIIVGDQIVGPYRLYVTVSPEPAQTGRVTFVVRISDPQSDDKVRDAEVTIELVHSEDGSVLTGEATHKDSGNPIDYAAHMQIGQPGVYNGTIRITGLAGPADVAFTQRVLAPRKLGTALALGLPFLVILGILGIVWYRRSGPSQPKSPEHK